MGLVERESRQGAPAYWIVDETSLPKAGKHSVGVARQYYGALGKLASCQVAVSLHRAGERAGQSRPLSWRLYLPGGWTEDVGRRTAAGIPASVTYQSKTDLALAVLDEALGWGAKPGVVLADEACGGSFRVARRPPWTQPGLRRARALDDHRMEGNAPLRGTEAHGQGAAGAPAGPVPWGPSRRMCARSPVPCRPRRG